MVEDDSADLYGTNPTPSTSEYNWLGGQGYRYRGSSGIYQVGARAYDPRMGRFLQQDPIGFGQGDYAYSGNSPANAFDPSGTAFVLAAGVGVVVEDIGLGAATVGASEIIVPAAIIAGSVAAWEYYHNAKSQRGRQGNVGQTGLDLPTAKALWDAAKQAVNAPGLTQAEREAARAAERAAKKVFNTLEKSKGQRRHRE